MAFETFVPQRIVTGKPKITIMTSGVFFINHIAVKKFFKDFKRTYLLYDREGKLIAFRPTDEQKGTFALSRSTNRSGISVSGRAFLQYFKIPCQERRSYDAIWSKNEKVVEIDLSQPL